MLGKKVKKLTKLMFTGLTMALCVAAFTPATKTEAAMLDEVEPNDNPATATQLPLNTWMEGVSLVDNDQDWYRFVIPSGGMTRIELNKGIENTYNSFWKVSIEDENRHNLVDFGSTDFIDYKIGLAPGKYYIKVLQCSTKGSKSVYNLRVSHTPSELWEKEIYYGNKNISNANSAYANKIYTGKLYDYRDVDWYRFKLSGKNKLSLRFTIDDTVANPGTWRVELQEYSSRKIFESYYVNTNDTLTVKQCSGDFIVKISNYGDSTGKLYHLQLMSTPLNSSNTAVKPSATKITSIKAGKGKATIYWKKASNASGYYVYRATSSSGTYKKVATVTGKTNYTDKKSLKSKKNYYYKIVSIKKSGSKILKSKASTYKRVKIK